MKRMKVSRPDLGLIQIALDSYIYKLEQRGIDTEAYEEFLDKLHEYLEKSEADDFILTEKPE